MRFDSWYHFFVRKIIWLAVRFLLLLLVIIEVIWKSDIIPKVLSVFDQITLF